MVKILGTLLQLSVHNLHNLWNETYGTNLVEVAIGAYALAKWYVKVESCHGVVDSISAKLQ